MRGARSIRWALVGPDRHLPGWPSSLPTAPLSGGWRSEREKGARGRAPGSISDVPRAERTPGQGLGARRQRSSLVAGGHSGPPNPDGVWGPRAGTAGRYDFGAWRRRRVATGPRRGRLACERSLRGPHRVHLTLEDASSNQVDPKGPPCREAVRPRTQLRSLIYTRARSPARRRSKPSAPLRCATPCLRSPSRRWRPVSVSESVGHPAGAGRWGCCVFAHPATLPTRAADFGLIPLATEMATPNRRPLP